MFVIHFRLFINSREPGFSLSKAIIKAIYLTYLVNKIGNLYKRNKQKHLLFK